ncbi:MAG: ribosomal protein S18-alanine N-acetyltransferase [Candidatus Accumulibacter sp.]|jgi:ribosomal-protein-alanine N-acetyltransferase|nr:ribosomal protein S18-alanine N-acetyltransferase [Accumulibacter sp.]
MRAALEPALEMLPMTARDIDDILRIECRVYSHPWSRANFVDSIGGGHSCWICRAGGEIAGYFVLMLAVDEAHLLNIGVAERRQGAGLGARLLRHAMDAARHGGAATLLLEVRPSNARALALYRHFGFRQIGLRRGYYPAAGGREDALVLARGLEETRA